MDVCGRCFRRGLFDDLFGSYDLPTYEYEPDYSGWDGEYGDGDGFYGNSYLDTAVSSSGGSGYIALGDGEFVSW